jgi:hypothetical protein
MGMRERRTLSAVFAALLAVPLAAVGVCGALVPLAASPSVCPAPTEAAADCCSRSSSPTCPRTPAPDRCAACGAAACALGETREAGRIPRRIPASNVADRPNVPRVVLRTAAARSLIVLAESPPKILLLATFRN